MQLAEQYDGQLEILLFLTFCHTIKITQLAVFELFAEGALDLPHAKRPRNDPAGPSGVFPMMDAVQPRLFRGRTYSQLIGMHTAPFPAATLKLPTVQFH